MVVSELSVELPSECTLGTLIDKGNLKESRLDGGIFTLRMTCGGARGWTGQRIVIVAPDAAGKTLSTLPTGC